MSSFFGDGHFPEAFLISFTIVLSLTLFNSPGILSLIYMVLLLDFYEIPSQFHRISTMVLLWDFKREGIYEISIGFLWGFKGTSLGFPVDSYQISGRFLWGPYWISMLCVLDFSDISMRILSDFRRISMGFKNVFNGFLRFFHGIPTGFLKDYYWIFMKFLWNVYGTSMVLVWNFLGISIGCSSYSSWIPLIFMIFLLNSCGISMICRLDFYDISMRLLSDFRRISMGFSQDVSMGCSMVFPRDS